MDDGLGEQRIVDVGEHVAGLILFVGGDVGDGIDFCGRDVGVFQQLDQVVGVFLNAPGVDDGVEFDAVV